MLSTLLCALLVLTHLPSLELCELSLVVICIGQCSPKKQNIYIYTHTYIYIYVHVCMHVCMYVRTRGPTVCLLQTGGPGKRVCSSTESHSSKAWEWGRGRGVDVVTSCLNQKLQEIGVPKFKEGENGSFSSSGN